MVELFVHSYPQVVSLGRRQPPPGEAEGAGETGWKLTFTAIPGVSIDTTGTAIAIALIVGRDTFVGGGDVDVRYIVDMTDIVVTALTSLNVPTFDVEIQYGTNAP